MDLQTRQIELRILTPSGNNWLTQVSPSTDQERTFSKKVYLGSGDFPENWEEWSEERKEAFEADLIERENLDALT